MDNEEQVIHTFTTPELAKFINEFVNAEWDLSRREKVGFSKHNVQLSLESYLTRSHG